MTAIQHRRGARAVERKQLRVLSALHGLGPLFGLQLARAAGFPIGSHHPTLAVLEAGGLIKGDWEHAASYPARRLYTITPAGRDRLLAAVDQP